MDEIIAGIIGTGSVAESHAKVLSTTDGVRLGFVVSRTPERTRRFADRFGAEVLADPDALVAKSDAVLVCSPNHSQTAYAVAALSAKKAVFCEKPGAISVAQAKELASAVDESGAVFQAGFNRRFAPAYRRLTDLLVSGELKPTSFNARINRGELQRPAWVGDPAVSGGYLFETTIHLFDMIRNLLGEVRSVQAHVSKGCYDQPDDFSMLLSMENGCHGVLSSCAHTSWQYPFERVELCGDHAIAVTEEVSTFRYTKELDGDTEEASFTDLEDEDRWGLRPEMEAFLARVRGERPDGSVRIPTVEDVLRNVELAVAVYAHGKEQDA